MSSCTAIASGDGKMARRRRNVLGRHVGGHHLLSGMGVLGAAIISRHQT